VEWAVQVPVCMPGTCTRHPCVPGVGSPTAPSLAAGVSASGAKATHPLSDRPQLEPAGGDADAASPPGPSSSSVRRRPTSNTTSTTTITTISTPPAI
jgi:hypothetical protein